MNKEVIESNESAMKLKLREEGMHAGGETDIHTAVGLPRILEQPTDAPWT